MLPITPPPLKPQAVAAGAKAASPGAAGKNKYTLYTKNDDNWHLKYEKYKTKYLELKYLNN